MALGATQAHNQDFGKEGLEPMVKVFCVHKCVIHARLLSNSCNIQAQLKGGLAGDFCNFWQT